MLTEFVKSKEIEFSSYDIDFAPSDKFVKAPDEKVESSQINFFVD